MNNLLKLLSVGLMLHPHFFRPATAQENCSGSTQIFINAALATANQDDGSLEVQGGFVYPPGFWKDENGNYTGCPCMIKKCIAHCSNFVHESARSKQLLLQVLPSYHHYHHHGSEKNISHNESSLILMDHGNSTDDFFEIFYPIDEETNADAQYIEHNNVHQRPLSRQDIIDHHHRSERICFLIQNQLFTIYEDISGEGEFHEVDDTIIAACMMVSVCSLTVLLVIFCISNETKFLHGKSIACQSLCLMIAFTGLALDYLTIFDLDTFKCTLMGYVIYFTTTSSFFWLNAMCFDMYWTFCYCNTGSSNSENKSKFRLYSYYAWICPLLMTFGVILSTVYVDKDSIWSTGIGNQGCFIQGRSIEGPFVYLYGPLLILLLMNFFFFFTTLIKICRTQKELGRILKVGNTTQKKYENHRKFFMYMKLFAVMNGVWMMEFASWITGYSDGIWYFFDICNCLRGLWLLIFCVLLSKRVRVGVRNSLSLQYSESKSSFNRNTTVVTSTSREKEQLEMNRIADGDESEMIATETNQTDPLSSTEN